MVLWLLHQTSEAFALGNDDEDGKDKRTREKMEKIDTW